MRTLAGSESWLRGSTGGKYSACPGASNIGGYTGPCRDGGEYEIETQWAKGLAAPRIIVLVYGCQRSRPHGSNISAYHSRHCATAAETVTAAAAERLQCNAMQRHAVLNCITESHILVRPS